MGLRGFLLSFGPEKADGISDFVSNIFFKYDHPWAYLGPQICFWLGNINVSNRQGQQQVFQ
jgi:hypothetical protein